MDTVLTSLFGLLLFVRLISFFMLYIIWSYLKNKVLAMQTLKDELIKEVIMALVPLTLSTDLLYIDIGPLKMEFAVTIYCTRLAINHYFFALLLLISVVRYLIIFHGPYIDLMEDKTVVKISRTISLIWALVALLFEIITQDLFKRPFFLKLTGEESPNFAPQTYVKTFAFITILDIIVIAFVHIRIEIYKRMGNVYPSESYKSGTVRAIVIILIICGLLLTSMITTSLFSATFIERLIFYIIINILALNIIPILMICKNENIVKYAKARFLCNNVGDNYPPV